MHVGFLRDLQVGKDKHLISKEQMLEMEIYLDRCKMISTRLMMAKMKFLSCIALASSGCFCNMERDHVRSRVYY